MAQLMARITVEDCLKKIDSQYELVMLAKERTSQLNSGNPMLVPQKIKIEVEAQENDNKVEEDPIEENKISEDKEPS